MVKLNLGYFFIIKIRDSETNSERKLNFFSYSGNIEILFCSSHVLQFHVMVLFLHTPVILILKLEDDKIERLIICSSDPEYFKLRHIKINLV